MLRGALINGALSGGIALLMFHSLDAVELWGTPSLGMDLLPQTFIVALVSVIFPTLATRKQLQTRELEQLLPGARHAPGNLALRAPLLALLATAALAAPTLAVLSLLVAGPVRLPVVIVLKVVYGAAVSALVTRSSVRIALTDPPESSKSAPHEQT
jgi:hypothetical protein